MEYDDYDEASEEGIGDVVEFMEDAENYFLRAKARSVRRSVEEEMRLLTWTYKDVVMKRPHKDCSAWAEEVIWELQLMQTKESTAWENRVKVTKWRLRAALRWLRRCGIRDIEYQTVMPLYWLDIAVVLYLSTNWALRLTYGNLASMLFD